jgi:DNA-binding response OmpR family regulator
MVMTSSETIIEVPNQVETVKILLVEDNLGDVRLVQEALKEGRLAVQFASVPDGIQALAYLRKQDKYRDASRPDIVLLDLNLPRKDGREVLAEMKADAELKRIPVVILTSSKSEEDIIKTYDLHANCYISKPLDFNKFVEVVKAIENFWMTIVKLPPN